MKTEEQLSQVLYRRIMGMFLLPGNEIGGVSPPHSPPKSSSFVDDDTQFSNEKNDDDDDDDDKQRDRKTVSLFVHTTIRMVVDFVLKRKTILMSLNI